jgi:hypothetical protein
LAQQVEFLQATTTTTTTTTAQSTSKDNDDDDDNIVQTKEASLVETVLSVLPTGYDFNKAVQQMTQSRSRAFWLYDVATPLRRLVDWQARYPSYNNNNNNNSNNKVRFLVTAQRVDQVWGRLLARMDRVGLVVHTNWEWDHCCCYDSDTTTGTVNKDKKDDTNTNRLSTVPSSMNTTTNKVLQLFDDSTRPGLRTDSFVRRVLSASLSSSRQRWQGWAVRGPHDVQRMYKVMQRLIQRHRWYQKNRNEQQQVSSSSYGGGTIMDNTIPQSCLSFVLRLPTNPTDSWTSLTHATIAEIQSVGGTLIGISLDWSTTDAPLVREKAIYDILRNTLSNMSNLRIDLTGLNDLDTAADDFTDAWWYQTLPQLDNVAEVTVEATDALLATAGALCTRIIGVRTMPDQRRHYYIDDGCYGSLSQNADATAPPLPLCASGNERMNHILDHDQTKDEKAPNDTVLHPSTVWGPTCDGLDRVCSDVALPSLQRDDWLIFPHVSSGGGQGLGTAFNGFGPPDTVYCVLGYFQ